MRCQREEPPEPAPATDRRTELLLEIDHWTGFSRHFTHLKSQEPATDKVLLLTAILADAINPGLTKMAEACPGSTVARLSWLSAWHIRDETYSKALAEIVNFQHGVPGKTGGYAAFEADLMLPQIAKIILVKKPLIDAETKLGKKHFPGVGRERGAAHPAHAVLLATNHKTVEVKVAPIECDLEQSVQRGDAAVAGHVQTPPYRRVDLEKQDVELVNFRQKRLAGP
jgi:hypothetical protein